MKTLINVNAAIIAGAMLVLNSGCVSAMVDAAMAKHGFHRATREQMLRPTTPSFPAPEIKTAIKSLPKEKLIGKWVASYVIDTRTALLSLGYDGPSQTMTSHQTYWLYEDGVCKMLISMNGKDTTWNGNWDYRDGVLTLVGAGGDGKMREIDLKILWYGETEFETRFADLSKYESMLREANPKSVKCRYDPSGILHTETIITSVANGKENEGATISVQSPQIYEREGDAE